MNLIFKHFICSASIHDLLCLLIFPVLFLYVFHLIFKEQFHFLPIKVLIVQLIVNAASHFIKFHLVQILFDKALDDLSKALIVKRMMILGDTAKEF